MNRQCFRLRSGCGGAQNVTRWHASAASYVLCVRQIACIFTTFALNAGSTAFELYQSMGLLDRQVRTVEGDGVPALVVHYEDIVDRATEAGYANATQRVAAFLGYEAPALRLALAGDHGRPKPKVNANNFKPPQRHYVEYLFLLSATAADWFPRLWPDCARYVDGARRRQRADLARRRR